MSDEEIDYNIPPRERLTKYMASLCLSHQMHCTELVIELVSDSGRDYLDNTLIPDISALLENDDEEVADSMLMMLPDFADAVSERFPEEMEDILISKILPMVHKLSENASDQYAESYAALILKLSNQSFVKIEVPFLLELSKNDNECVRITLASIILFLVEHIDPSTWYNGLIDIITTFTSDSSVDVRMKTPPLIALYAKELKMPREKAQLSGKFTLMVRDPSPEVRAGAAESLVTLCMSLDPSSKIITIIPTAKLLLNDQSEEVRNCMCKNLGPLISSLGRLADRSLISQFCTSMISTDVNVSFANAYSYPAVALALGKERIGELHTAFDTAAASREYRIRRTLSYGLFSYSHLLEKDEVTEIALNFLKDIPSVAIGVIENLDKFIEIAPNKKDEFLACIKDPINKFPEWRVRFKVSEQCRKCSKFFKKEDLFQIAKKLACDSISIVRKDAAKTISMLIGKDKNSDFINFITKLSKSENYFEREEAALIISYIESKWVGDFCKILEKLANDPVVNVRILAAKATISLKQKVLLSISLARLIKKFKNDPDIDVVRSIENDN